jgi:enterochelin esterase family protein
VWCLVALCCGGVPAGAASRIESGLAVPSALLHKPIPYAVYMPEAATPKGGWPVLYMLHGLNGNEMDWVKAGRLGATLDELIAAKKLPPLLVVMPMAGNSWYVDDARGVGFGPMARAMLTEFMPEIERRYPVAACRQARAIGGLSMGGYGALLYSLERPDLFGAAISLSGSIFPELTDADGARQQRLAQIFRGVHGEPFDRTHYEAWNLYSKLRGLPSTGNKPSLFLTAADGDFPLLLQNAVTFQLAAASAGLKSELRVEDGAHSWPYWAEAVKPALLWLGGVIAPSCG